MALYHQPIRDLALSTESPLKRKFQKENEIKKNFGYPWGFCWPKCFNPIKRLKRKPRRPKGSYWLAVTTERTTKSPIHLEPKHWWMEGFGSISFGSYTWPWTRKTKNELRKSQNLRIWKACRSKKSITVSFKWVFVALVRPQVANFYSSLENIDSRKISILVFSIVTSCIIALASSMMVYHALESSEDINNDMDRVIAEANFDICTSLDYYFLLK